MQTRAPIRLVLADDHPFVLMGLKLVFDTPDFLVVETCEDGADTLAAVRKHHPDVLVLDLQMPALDGTAVLREMQREKLSTRTIVLSGNPTSREITTLSGLGARAVLKKTEAPERLLQCVRDVHAGGSWEPVMEAVAEPPRRQRLRELLTPREMQIVEMIAAALPNKAIAQKLGIAEGTVKLHLHRIYDKLKLRGRMDLLLYLTEAPAAPRQ